MIPVLATVAAHGVRFRLRHPARTLSALAAAAVLLFALTSPIDLLARGTLFSAHMLQHLLLVLAAPPLAVLALPRCSTRATARRLPFFVSWMLGVGAMWLWHAPLLCNEAAISGAVRALQTPSRPWRCARRTCIPPIHWASCPSYAADGALRRRSINSSAAS